MASLRGVFSGRDPSSIRSLLDPPIGLHMRLRHDSALAAAPVEVVAWRRPELIVRRTDYAAFVVDERLLTQVYPWRAASSRLTAMFVLSGCVRFPGLDVHAGRAALLIPHHQANATFDHARFLEVEWTTEGIASLEGPRALDAVDPANAAELAEWLDDPSGDPRRVFEAALALARSAGAPTPTIDVRALRDGPSDRDLRIARAIEGQLASLASSADTSYLAEIASLSPRQLQRVLADFGRRYGVHVDSWRDLRNRWRVQLAVVLLGVPGVAVADVAREVGYASPRALARALANAGFASPSELRARRGG